VAFPVSVVHQFYFVHTAQFVDLKVNANTAFLVPIFGVGGASLMTIGQIAEIIVLACMPFILKKWSRKQVLSFGLVAYIVRFAVFAYLPYPAAIVPALALHGLCFGCFIFVAFIIVDEECGKDVRASAQGLFNFVVIGIGIIVGNLFAGEIGTIASGEGGAIDYAYLFTVPLVITVVSLLVLLALYPGGMKNAPETRS
jgi:MFS family permease